MKALKPFQDHLPRGTQIVVRGQVETMRSSFFGLGVGLLGAIVLVYLLIVVNFQSWLDPFIIITALPGALAGICWFLLITRTTLSVPSLTGAVMCMGVATANSILLVSFSRDRMNAGVPARQAALEAGYTRMRPVIMTALAMIIGMVPMALGFGEGGEQNAPLGRAVIGGLLFATVATLFFVPSVFTMIHGRREARLQPNGSRPQQKQGRTEQRTFWRPAIMPVQTPPVTTEQNETEAVRPDDYQPSDLGSAPVGRAKDSDWRRAARPDHRRRSYVSEPEERNRCAGERNRSRVGSNRRGGATDSPSPETTNWCCPEICRPLKSLPFLPAPTATFCAGTRTWEARFRKGNCWRRLILRKSTRSSRRPEPAREQIKAALELAKISADRWANLRKSDSVSQQEADQQASGYQQAQANLAAADANVRRLEQLESFKNVYAPFSGVLTRRNVDPGALINSGARGGGQRAVRYRARRSASRLRQRSAGVCAEHEGRDEGNRDAAGVSRPEISWGQWLAPPMPSIPRRAL